MKEFLRKNKSELKLYKLEEGEQIPLKRYRPSKGTRAALLYYDPKLNNEMLNHCLLYELSNYLIKESINPKIKKTNQKIKDEFKGIKDDKTFLKGQNRKNMIFININAITSDISAYLVAKNKGMHRTLSFKKEQFLFIARKMQEIDFLLKEYTLYNPYYSGPKNMMDIEKECIEMILTKTELLSKAQEIKTEATKKRDEQLNRRPYKENEEKYNNDFRQL